MKKTPLKRKTRLRAAGPGIHPKDGERQRAVAAPTSPGPAARKQAKDTRLAASNSIKALGKRGRRLAPGRSRSGRAVRQRSGGFCENPGCGRPNVAWAHIFGRGNIVSEPMASSPELTMDLCTECHDAIDRGFDLDLRERLRWLAVERAAETADAPATWLDYWRLEGWSAKDALLTMLRQLAEREAA